MNKYVPTIAELTSAVRIQMIRLKYPESSLYVYDLVWKDMMVYCNMRKAEAFSTELGTEFTRDVYGNNLDKQFDKRRRVVGQAMQHLSDYQMYGVIFDYHRRSKYQLSPHFKDVFDDFLASMIKAGYAEKTITKQRNQLHMFENFLIQQGIKQFSKIRREDIEQYILTFGRFAQDTVRGRLQGLRKLLIFAYQRNYHTEEFADACPRMRHFSKRQSIPSTFTSDEVNRLLLAVDRANPCGKRDYAILLLIAKLGLRASDVRGLKLSDIDWHHKQLCIYQSKTKQTVVLPLLDDVGWAFIDYLKNGRPKTDCEFLFVRHIAEYGEIRGNMYEMLQKYLNRANIVLGDHKRKHGLHALRHSLASELLSKETPLPVISGILGHMDTQSTSVYLKVDIKHLRICALEVPA